MLAPTTDAPMYAYVWHVTTNITYYSYPKTYSFTEHLLMLMIIAKTLFELQMYILSNSYIHFAHIGWNICIKHGFSFQLVLDI